MQGLEEYGYAGVFLALIAAGFGFPIPEELPVLTAGVLVGHEDTALRWYLMLPVVMLGVVLGDGVLYGIGRLWGSRLLSIGWVQRKLIPPDKRLEIEKNFADKGIMVLLGARMLPGIRSPIFIMAGVLRVPVGRFLLADGIYAIPLVNVLFWSAYILTDQVMTVYNQIRKVQHEYGPLVLVIVFSGVGGILIYKYVFSRKVSTGEPPPPIITKPAQTLGHVIETAVEAVTKRHHHEKAEEEKKEDELPPGQRPLDPPKEPPAPSTLDGEASLAAERHSNGFP